MTFSLPSPAGATLWTTTTMDKVLREAAPPEGVDSGITMYAAKNEHEPFQIAIRAASAADATLELTAFDGPGTIGGATVRRVEYVTIGEPSDASSIPSGRIPDPLVPTTFGAQEPLPAGENQPFWITVYVPPDAEAGDYVATLTVSVDGDSVDIPSAFTSTISRSPLGRASTGAGTRASRRSAGARASRKCRRSKTSSSSIDSCRRASPGPPA